MKKCFSICLIAIFLIFSSAIAMAMPATEAIPIEQQSELPNWLIEVGAQTIPDTELAMVQGEIYPLWAVYMAYVALGGIAVSFYQFMRYCLTNKPMSSTGQNLFIQVLTGYEVAAGR